MAVYHGIKEMDEGESCDENGDVLFEGAYFGGSISVWETGCGRLIGTSRMVS